jgi:hypothetical protein
MVWEEETPTMLKPISSDFMNSRSLFASTTSIGTDYDYVHHSNILRDHDRPTPSMSPSTRFKLRHLDINVSVADDEDLFLRSPSTSWVNVVKPDSMI